MGQHESEDELGNPWLVIIVGIACLLLAWYVYSTMGVLTNLIGKAAVANSGIGKKVLIGLLSLVGAFFIFRGVKKLRAGD